MFLTRFGELGASSRLRYFQYQPGLEAAGIDCTFSAFIDDRLIQYKYKAGNYSLHGLLSAYWHRYRALRNAHEFDLVWIEKEALPWFPVWVERWFLRETPYILDFDDAIFHNYDLHRFNLVRCIYGRRIDRLMVGSSLVISGNRYLANRAIKAGAQRVRVVPTVIDLARYTPKSEYSYSTIPLIAWIGSPSTVKYLLDLATPLNTLSMRRHFVLRVIGGGNVEIPGVTVECIKWTEENEAKLLTECDIGIMPIRNSPWEQGKCAYKLIQYMACGLPTVASPIGANLEVVENNETGLFASSNSEWVTQLELLLCDISMRRRLGVKGRERVETAYCLQKTGPEVAQLLRISCGTR